MFGLEGVTSKVAVETFVRETAKLVQPSFVVLFAAFVVFPTSLPAAEVFETNLALNPFLRLLKLMCIS